jgi:predicted nucleic acid-binding protein
MVWLYFLQASSPFYPDATKLFYRIAANQHQMVSSPLILGELLVLPKRNGDTFTEAAYKQLFKRSPIAMLTDISSISETFSEIRAIFRFASADTLHLSLASVANVDIFVTEDQKLANKSVPGIGSILTIQQTFAKL